VWHTLLISWFPLLLIVGLWFLLFRQMQAGGGKAMSFGKSRARLLSESQQRITFADVAGVDEAKAELEEIVSFLRDPKKFTRLGGRIPKGVLLVGAPGTGKTLLARAIAGEASVPFFSISGSDFVEMFVGVGASRVRDLFMQGKKNAPCIIFVDEIDAVGRHRGAGLGGGHDEREQTLNQLLVEMDGFESSEGVIIIAATNRPDVLDPAMLRPGRFDRHVVVSSPDLRGREAILRVHARKILLGSDVDLSKVARGTPGFTGADLENLCNEAALLAARREGEDVTKLDFEMAKDKVLMGSERRSLTLSDRERRVTAYHEAGHALVAMLEEHCDPLHKVSIIPRGQALGVTMTLPTEDRFLATKEQLLAMIRHAMGGRASEEIVFEQFSTGASDDLAKATKIAREMVCTYGMSEKLGPMSIEDSSPNVFLGRDLGMTPKHSAETARSIDHEVQRILTEAYERAQRWLIERRPLLDAIAQNLLERETLDDQEIAILMDGGELPPMVAPSTGTAVTPPKPKDEEAEAAQKPRFGDKGIPEPEPVPG
jgi:cell division protease FtsH